jgi:hypothetical protein
MPSKRERRVGTPTPGPIAEVGSPGQIVFQLHPDAGDPVFGLRGFGDFLVSRREVL